MLDDDAVRGLVVLLLLASLSCIGCRRAQLPAGTEQSPDAATPAETAATAAPPVPASTGQASTSAETPKPGASNDAVSKTQSATKVEASAARCPAAMAHVPGGEFWVGSDPSERFSQDESPRFLTRLAPFCLDESEVTAGAYAACVERGVCTPTRKKRTLCNGGRKDRLDHPMNCITFDQAESFCRQRGARLPTEVEWEYAARGGSALLTYPWGEGSPDGRACWKHVGTCNVKRFAPGAFGLFDLSGNVWEWTATFYGPYPWPPETGYSRVYRGGSFSRRFEKWMHTRLRNRAAAGDSGSHLGLRCALTLPGTACPFGAGENGECRHGVISRSCPQGETFNGVRCAKPGEPRCRPGRIEKPGFGCVLGSPETPGSRDLEAEARQVVRERSPEFDQDCEGQARDRRRAFRYAGGSHEARNLVSRRDGCKNRDVGVGWNSTCCP
jgi:formylglycine-generating enzyme required for sulfatase activity